MTTTTLSPITQRFAWKEYRTLRGFWIAAFVLGVLIQWLAYAIHDRPPGTDWPTALFIVGLVTAALYAVGVAATTFSMEHEDETYAFLNGLPTRWRPEQTIVVARVVDSDRRGRALFRKSGAPREPRGR